MSGSANRRIAILISGRGSNMLALLDAVKEGRLEAVPAVVISNREDAQGLQLARERGVDAVCISSKGLTRSEHERAVMAEIERRDCQLICLAGYMRLLSGAFVRAFSGRILNIHPSLLPAFPGLGSQRQALEYGVRYTGCTVHYVDEGCDTGPILLQAVVPVKEDDTEDTLSARILEQEHRIYAEAVQLVLDGAVQLVGRRVVFRNAHSL